MRDGVRDGVREGGGGLQMILRSYQYVGVKRFLTNIFFNTFTIVYAFVLKIKIMHVKLILLI